MGFFQRLFGREKLEARPEIGRFMDDRRNDFHVDRSARRLTPAKLGAILREAEAGSIIRQYEMFEAVEADPKVFQCLTQRRRALLARELQIAPPQHLGGDSRALEIAGWCEEQLGRIDNLEEALFDATDAIGKAFSIAQLIWDVDGSSTYVSHIERWQQRDCRIGLPGKTSAQDFDRIRILTTEHPTDGEVLAPGQWLLHIYKARSVALVQAAMLRIVSWSYVFKHLDLKGWLIFAERFGMPLRVGKYGKGSQDDERKAVRDAVISLGMDGAAVLPDTASIEFIYAKAAAGQLPYPDLVAFCDSQIALAILGQTLTSEVGSAGGSLALGNVHQDVAAQLTEADAGSLGRALTRTLIRPLVHYNFGPDAPVPDLTFPSADTDDLLEAAKTMEIVAGTGLELSKNHLRRKYNQPAPENDEDTLVASAKPAQMAAALTAGTCPEHGYVHALTEKKRSEAWVM